jgi:hypothetical protein
MKASIILSLALTFVLAWGFSASADTGDMTPLPTDNNAEVYGDDMGDNGASDGEGEKKKKGKKNKKKKGKKGKKGGGKKAKKDADLE